MALDADGDRQCGLALVSTLSVWKPILAAGISVSARYDFDATKLPPMQLPEFVVRALFPRFSTERCGVDKIFLSNHDVSAKGMYAFARFARGGAAAGGPAAAPPPQIEALRRPVVPPACNGTHA
ncbi:hypothetical protein Emag_006567 [Eimeria magna]